MAQLIRSRGLPRPFGLQGGSITGVGYTYCRQCSATLAHDRLHPVPLRAGRCAAGGSIRRDVPTEVGSEVEQFLVVLRTDSAGLLSAMPAVIDRRERSEPVTDPVG